MKQILSNTILYTNMCEILADEKTPTYMVIYNYDATGRPIGMPPRLHHGVALRFFNKPKFKERIFEEG